MTQIKFRRAQPLDVNDAVPLIYSSGMPEFDYGFSCDNHKAIDFLTTVYTDGSGFFGWRNHVVATANNTVIGIAACYSGDDYLRLSLELISQVVHFYPPQSVPYVLWRMHLLQSRMPKPGKLMHYVANFGVRSDMRGKHVGSTLLLNQIITARELGKIVMALDVSVDNPRAQTLYERLGFKAVRLNKFIGDKKKLADTVRMEMPINLC